MAGSRLTPLLDGGRYFEAPRWHDHRLWLVDSVARMIMDKVGRTYVGDLGFDLKSGIKNGPYGRIILVEAGREPRVVADGLNFPNGIAISDDSRQIVRTDGGNRLDGIFVGPQEPPVFRPLEIEKAV